MKKNIFILPVLMGFLAGFLAGGTVFIKSQKTITHENKLQTTVEKFARAEEVCGDSNVKEEFKKGEEKNACDHTGEFTCEDWRKASMTSEEIQKERDDIGYRSDCFRVCDLQYPSRRF